MGLLTNIKIIFFCLKLKKQLKQQIWKCKRKCILCQFWNTLAEYFRDIESKAKSLPPPLPLLDLSPHYALPAHNT